MERSFSIAISIWRTRDSLFLLLLYICSVPSPSVEDKDRRSKFYCFMGDLDVVRRWMMASLCRVMLWIRSWTR